MESLLSGYTDNTGRMREKKYVFDLIDFEDLQIPFHLFSQNRGRVVTRLPSFTSVYPPLRRNVLVSASHPPPYRRNMASPMQGMEGGAGGGAGGGGGSGRRAMPLGRPMRKVMSDFNLQQLGAQESPRDFRARITQQQHVEEEGGHIGDEEEEEEEEEEEVRMPHIPWAKREGDPPYTWRGGDDGPQLIYVEKPPCSPLPPPPILSSRGGPDLYSIRNSR